MVKGWTERIQQIHYASGWLLKHAEEIDRKSANLWEIINGEKHPFNMGEWLAGLLECDIRDALTLFYNWQHIDGLSRSEAQELIEKLNSYVAGKSAST